MDCNLGLASQSRVPSFLQEMIKSAKFLTRAGRVTKHPLVHHAFKIPCMYV
jgi:hypothetical protein